MEGLATAPFYLIVISTGARASTTFFKAMDTNLSSLSPAAQALKVKDAAYALPIGTGLRSRIAAALEAAADQVVPDESHPKESQFWDDEAEQEWQNNRHVRLQLLAIAAELKGQS
jgi:hypothetical protein